MVPNPIYSCLAVNAIYVVAQYRHIRELSMQVRLLERCAHGRSILRSSQFVFLSVRVIAHFAQSVLLHRSLLS